MQYLRNLISVLFIVVSIESASSVFDNNLYRDVLDPALCQKQLDFIGKHAQLQSQFMDAGFRMPQGILQGNLVSLGNYHECLAIKEESDNSVLEGKYCTIKVPLAQNNFERVYEDQNILWVSWVENLLNARNENLLAQITQYNRIKAGIESTMGLGSRRSRNVSAEPEFMLAVCVPKSCTARQALESMYLNLTASGLQYEEGFCRLPHDKLFSTADVVACVIFGGIGLLTIMSTCYDVNTFKSSTKGSELSKKVFRSFSVYSNARTLVSCRVKDQSVGFIAGVKALSVMWAIVAHSHVIHITSLSANPLDIIGWLTSTTAVWITSYHLVFDTLIMLTGVFVLNYLIKDADRKKTLFTRTPLLYLNRFRRLLPVLAIVILLQASILNHVSDGPNWYNVARNTENCRENWWLNLLGAQNDANQRNMCLSHSWYLGVEGVLYLLSPFLVMGLIEKSRFKRNLSFVLNFLIGMILVASLSYTKDVPSSLFATSRPERLADYFVTYYTNGLIRGSPFFIGLNVGYLMYVFPKRPSMPKSLVALLWFLTTLVAASLLGMHYPIVQLTWNNVTIDAALNAHMRYFWMACMSWIIFACAKGHGGAVNWFLSLKIWKVLGRMSVTMYLIHMPLLHVMHGTALAPIDFDPKFVMCRFMINYTLTAIVAFILMLLVERPCSALAKCFISDRHFPRSTSYMMRLSSRTCLPVSTGPVKMQEQQTAKVENIL